MSGSYLYNVHDTISIRDGKVGIGTTNPREKFHVQDGSIYVERMTNIDSNIDFAYSTLSNVKSLRVDNLFSQSSSTINVTNTTLSNVANAYINTNLVVGQTITASNLNIIGDFTTLNTLTSNTEQMTITNAGTGPALIVTQTDAQPIASFYDDSEIAVQIADLGMVGIGTDAPEKKLHIVETASVPANIKITNAAGSLYVGSNVVGGVGLYEFLSTANEPIRLGTNSSEAIRVATDGNVGIGTTVTPYKLDVNGKTRVQDALYLRTGGMNTIFYSYGGKQLTPSDPKNIGIRIAWANLVDDTKYTFRVMIKCHLASDSSVAYRKFESLITPKNDGSTMPKEVVATEIADTTNNDFSTISHSVQRVSDKSVDLKVSWAVSPSSFVGNVQIEIFAHSSLGDFTFTAIP